MLDYNKPTPPLPASCVSLTERFSQACSELLDVTPSIPPAEINQLTINEYLPGQGIAPHTGLALLVVIFVYLWNFTDKLYFFFF